MDDDPTLGRSEAQLWAFAAGLHEKHGKNVGDVFIGMFRHAMQATDRAGYDRWCRVMDMLHALNGPDDPNVLQ
ncbi:hypothetical protein [Sphingomonas montana]|uniref:hypothetical protein n=1 Tax=Sphingomonas montana TaxID=1843236 RepID=UPI00096E135D|nr:hypothetical protein [Sphingomonas montana]